MSDSSIQRGAILRRHDWVDERSRVLHSLIAQKIRHEPQLLDIARTNLARWRTECGQDVEPVFAEWEALIRGSTLESLLAFLEEKGERANRMRQSSPFTGILTPAERNRILAEYEAL